MKTRQEPSWPSLSASLPVLYMCNILLHSIFKTYSMDMQSAFCTVLLRLCYRHSRALGLYHGVTRYTRVLTIAWSTGGPELTLWPLFPLGPGPPSTPAPPPAPCSETDRERERKRERARARERTWRELLGHWPWRGHTFKLSHLVSKYFQTRSMRAITLGPGNPGKPSSPCKSK